MNNRPTIKSAFIFFLLLTSQSITLSGVQRAQSQFGMVVAGHPEAAQIGASILKKGGNAIDAVVATGFALGVAEPYGSGIGGKCALLYFHRASNQVYFLDGLDSSGAKLDVKAFIEAGREKRTEGAIGVGIPGFVATMQKAHDNWGSFPWTELIEPSIALAESGFEVVPGMDVFFTRRKERIQSNPECARIYWPNNHPPQIGDKIPNSDLAETMRTIAKKGATGFYTGIVAETIVSELRASGSHLTLDDFANYQARSFPPLRIENGKFIIYSSGRPTSGGATALKLLHELHSYNWSDRESLRKPKNIDTIADVMRQLYPHIQKNMADTDDFYSRWQTLLNSDLSIEMETQLEQPDLVETISNRPLDLHTLPSAQTLIANKSYDDSWTTHFVVVDRFGNIASVTQSLSHHFGSGVVAKGTGVVLNNSLKNFSFSNPEGVNYAAPNKRPRSTIAPTIVFRRNLDQLKPKPYLSIGLPGGARIPTTLAITLIDCLQFHRTVGEAIDDRRFHLKRSWSDLPDSNLIQLESGTPGSISEKLKSFGWKTEILSDTEAFGGITAIEVSVNSDFSQTFTGWADSRRTNEAAGANQKTLLSEQHRIRSAH